MLDLHCHILPGVDDGPTTLEEALAVARLAAADGITHVVATPHCHRHIRMTRDLVLPHVRQFHRALAEADVRLTVLPGSEIQVFDSALYRREFEAGLYCHLGDGSSFTLLEFAWDARRYPADAPELVGWLRERRMTPIVAHPERYKFFRDDPARLRAVADAGAWLQVTVDSLLGNHGEMPQTFGTEILDGFADVVLATDAHRTGRCSGLSAGYAWVRARFGPERERDLRERSTSVLEAIQVSERCERPDEDRTARDADDAEDADSHGLRH
jgi:protein-tyrosine phosphatase